MEIFRNLARRRVRTALTISGIVIGICALTTTGAMAEHFNRQLEGGVAYYSSNIQVSDAAGTAAGVISLGKVDAIGKVPGVAIALPSVRVPIRPGSGGGVLLGLPATVGYSDPRESEYCRFKETVASPGRPLQPRNRGEVVLGSDLVGELGVKVGDSLDLPLRPANPGRDFVSHTFKVVGILKPTGSIPDETASVSLQDAQQMLQESLPISFRDRVDPSSLGSAITVYGKPGVNLDQLADRINQSLSGVAATRPSEFVSNFNQVSARITAIAIGTALLALVIGGLSVANTMLMAVVERGREIGLKLALGAHGWHVLVEYLFEAASIGLAGGAIGFLLGAGLSLLLDLAGRTASLDVFLVTSRLAGIALGIALVLGIGAGLIPALRAARLDPDLALRA